MIGFAESLRRFVGLDNAALDFGMLSRCQRTLNVSHPYSGGVGRLTLLICCFGTKSERDAQ